jgi:hypothetical protein
MFSGIKLRLVFVSCLVLACVPALQAQQKGQYVPGQQGLNAGVIPDPGFTYANLAINYSASEFNDSNGNHVSGVSGTYAFWLYENIFYYVSNFKFLGARFAPYVAVNFANGSLVADVTGTNLGASGGGVGLSDTWVEPVNLGWHLKRADINVGYAFVAPTGRFTAGATNNVGSGYWGNDITTGTTFYITKNKATSANFFTDWEKHGQKSGTSISPGQTFTDEWGLGQILPLKKDFSRLLQLGVIGYDQWQISNNGGYVLPSVPASTLPYYSLHAIGLQTDFILPAKGVNLFFKYEDEYSVKAAPQGRTFVFGGSWTLRIPKPAPPPPPPPAPKS